MRSARLLAALLALTAPLASSLARAQGAPAAAPVSPGVDEVSLKSGGFLRGTVIASEPDKQVVILVGSEPRTVPWAEIAKVERGKYAAPPAAAPLSPLPVAPPAVLPQSLGLGTPRIHIAADNPDVTLNRVNFALSVASIRGAAPVVAQVVCRAPCDQVIEGREGQDFFFGGDGIMPSRKFALSDKGGDLVANVSAGSVGRRLAGMFLSIPAGAVTTVGAVLLGIAAAPSAPAANETGGGSTRSSSSLAAPGGIMLGIGAAALVTGIVLWSTSGTSYTLAPASASARVGKVRFERGALLF